jgi:hypothetical protein
MNLPGSIAMDEVPERIGIRLVVGIEAFSSFMNAPSCKAA